MNMNLKELMLQYPNMDAATLKAIADSDKLFNPCDGMTALEAHIFKCEEIIDGVYADAQAENNDPFESLANSEEQYIAMTGFNYAGHIIQSK